MPELPEVETTVRQLNSSRAKIINARFVDVWTDSPKIIKEPKSFSAFKKAIKGKKIKKIWRKGKNIIFTLSDNFYLLVHQKLTGHLLVSKWKIKNGKAFPENENEKNLKDRVNTYIHVLFSLDNGQMIALSDLRKFAKIALYRESDLEKEINILGPEPLDKNFTLKKFKEIISKKRGRIKQVLMDQSVIAGIGNIYSDEILWHAKINPFRSPSSLSEKELKRIYEETKKILKKAIEVKGSSIVDYRTVNGEKGNFEKFIKVYRKEGGKCVRCGSIIKRAAIGGRTAHFCPTCQK